MFIFFKKSDCFLKTKGSITPNPYTKKFNGIFAVIREFFCLKEPPAAFLGLANLSFIFLKSLLPI